MDANPQEKLFNGLKEERLGRMEKLDAVVTPSDTMCFECTQLYRGKCEGRMSVRCTAASDVRLRAERGWAKEVPDFDLYEVFSDPVTWAKVMLNWTARWYQEELLRCSAQKKVVRAGRRLGKTCALAVDALHKACTRPNQEILIICPYQSQVTLVFDVIRQFVRNSEELTGSLFRDPRNPERIEFLNGSYLLGITAGTRTGMKGEKARGQNATAMYLDEADYLDQPTLEALLAIFASHEDCTLWASSTPTGARSFFYEWCMNKDLDFREFHYSSDKSPAWRAETELYFRQTYTEMAYIHEFEAEFGEEEAGVYRNSYIEQSLRDYSLANYPIRKGKKYIRTLGVDWNSAKNGVHLVGVEYEDTGSSDTSYMTICLHEAIQATQFTQTKAVERIIELHKIWGFDYIYVDAGWGETQVEQLHMYGKKHPSSGLGDIVKPIAMGSKLIIRDPFNGQEMKKNAKHLMVNISARRVESLQCILPKSEDQKRGVVHQMRNFRAEKINRDGIPTYETSEDHALVAWQLAILALVMEFSEMTKTNFARRIAFANIYKKPGEMTSSIKETSKREKVEQRFIVPRAANLDTTSRTLAASIRRQGSGRGGGLRKHIGPSPGRRATF